MAKSYSKMAMADALRELSRKKNLRKITINEIVDACGLSKRTFYNNFYDKYDLVYYTCTLDTDAAMKDRHGYREALASYYGSVIEKEHFYRSFIRDPELQQLLHECVVRMTTEYIRDRVKQKRGLSDLSEDLSQAIRFCAGGQAELFLWWISGNMRVPPEDLAGVTFECVPDMLKEYLAG